MIQPFFGESAEPEEVLMRMVRDFLIRPNTFLEGVIATS